MDPDFRGIIFCRTKIDTQTLCNDLNSLGIRAEALNGDLNQNQRDRVMKKFKQHQVEILIATDVAARGIDVNNLTHVVHHSLPEDISYYTHRSGRTARAGKEGISIVMIDRKELPKVKAFEKKLKISFGEIEIPDEKKLIFARLNKWALEIIEKENSDTIDEEIIKSLFPLFNHLSKEELIKKLIAKEINGISIGKKIEKQNPPKDKKKKNREANGNGSKLFINLGKIDGFNKKELANYISRQSRLKDKGIKQVNLFDRYSFVEIEHQFRDQVVRSFQNQTYKGHKLRVNMDNNGVV